MGVNRHSLVEAVDGIIQRAWRANSRRNLEGQLDLFSVMSGESQTSDTDSYEIKPFPEYSHTELLQQEKEVSGSICPATRWTPIGNSRHALRPTASRSSPARMPTSWTAIMSVSCVPSSKNG